MKRTTCGLAAVFIPLLVFATSARAQSGSVYFGGGTASDSSAGPIDTLGAGITYTTPRMGGFFDTVGGDVILFHHLGVGAEVSFVTAKGLMQVFSIILRFTTSTLSTSQQFLLPSVSCRKSRAELAEPVSGSITRRNFAPRFLKAAVPRRPRSPQRVTWSCISPAVSATTFTRERLCGHRWTFAGSTTFSISAARGYLNTLSRSVTRFAAITDLIRYRLHDSLAGTGRDPGPLAASYRTSCVEAREAYVGSNSLGVVVLAGLCSTAAIALCRSDTAQRLLTQASAPANRVNSITVSDSCIDKKTILVFGERRRIWRAAAVPPIKGMLRSRSTRSGSSSTTFSIASSPLPASPQTSQRSRNKFARPSRTTS